MKLIGTAVPRIDGRLKVSGVAKYSSDYAFPDMVFVVGVGSTVARGKVVAIDDARARSMPGVIEIFHHGNFEKLAKPTPDDGMFDEERPPLSDDVVSYYGQYVAAVVAETFEEATAAAACIDVTYETQDFDVSLDLHASDPEVESERGDADAAFAAAAVTVDRTYVTPAETHNPIELHASVVVADGERVTMYDTTQAVGNYRSVMRAFLDTPPENVRVITKFLGSGFGGKLWVWAQAPLAAAVSRKLGRPVKFVVTRKQMFETVGHRPRTQQRVRMGALTDGTLTSLHHDYVNVTGMLDEYEEDCGEATAFFYGVPNVRVTKALAKRNVGPPTSMRGPGAVPGLFATESAYDELAIELGIDPVELRKRNEPQRDLAKNIPFSSRHYVECLTEGAQRFGWERRSVPVGSMRDGDEILGWGMAGCSWMAARLPATVRVELRGDGTVHVASGTQDIGTGTYTVIAQIVAEELKIPISRVVVEIGDSDLPSGPMSGGSMVTASMVPATLAATRQAVKALDKHKTPNAPSDSFEHILRAAGVENVSGQGSSGGTFTDKHPKFSIHSYGAQFVEVGWQPQIARLRVRRMVCVIDGGAIINARTARNQVEGAMIMGVGMSLFEQTTYDPRSGAPINSNLADYVVATHADAPKLDVAFLDYPDMKLNEIGARGVGEIGLAGVAPAIAAAVHHATGVRVRELPIEIEKLLTA